MILGACNPVLKREHPLFGLDRVPVPSLRYQRWRNGQSEGPLANPQNGHFHSDLAGPYFRGTLKSTILGLKKGV